MDYKAREFGLFIDGLRLERNISREDLCEGIMSLSQYKRYLRGDTSMPNAKLVQLADRLMFSLSDIYSLFGKKHDDNYKKIWEIYTLIRKNESKSAIKCRCIGVPFSTPLLASRRYVPAFGHAGSKEIERLIYRT